MASGPSSSDAEVTSPLRGEVDAKRRVRGSASRARSLRRNETDAEHKFWQMVRGRQIGGWKFVRQVAIGPYFADFACREAALIIELDGSQHLDSPTDQARTGYLTAHGYSVLRFWNSDILGNPHGAAESILAAIAGHPSPGERFAPATLSPEGRGERGTIAATTRQRSYRLTADIPRLLKDR
jgi:very-short-patch-repair endonuclease